MSDATRWLCSVRVRERPAAAIGFPAIARRTDLEEFGMSAHAMCKASHHGIGLAIVELTDVSHIFATTIPQSGSTLREQAENVGPITETAAFSIR